MLSSDDVEQAIRLFEFTAKAYPASAPARDGLAQARETARLLASGKQFDFVYSCPPCGGACDGQKFERGGNCPHCGMILNRRAVPRADDVADEGVRREAALQQD